MKRYALSMVLGGLVAALSLALADAGNAAQYAGGQDPAATTPAESTPPRPETHEEAIQSPSGEPASDPPALTLPETIEVAPLDIDNPRLRAKILEMIERRKVAKETGDPILDGILDALRSRGSVIDGSALEWPTPVPSDDAADGIFSPSYQPSDQLRMPPRLPSSASGPATSGPNESDFLLAEQLLKTARMLRERSDEAGENYSDLISKLREEARRALSSSATAPANPARSNPRTLGPEPASYPAY